MSHAMIVCPKCQRHVFATETDCPFCKADFRRVVKLAAVAALALSVGVTITACAYGGPIDRDTGGVDANTE